MIKARYVACAALALALAGCGRSQPASSQSSPSASPATTMTPATGQSGLAAYQAKRRASIMRADADHDGRISEQEWITWRTAHPGKGSDPVKQFQKYDTNHDGFVTPDEIDAVSAKLFVRREAMQGAT